MDDEFTEQIIGEIKKLIGPDTRVMMPPKVFRDMQGRFLAYDAGKSLRAAYPVLERYEGPTGIMQGGIIIAAFDSVYGAFSYLLTSCFCATLSLNTSFVRPITRRDGEIIIEVGVIDHTKQFLLMEGKAFNPQGKLLARCTSQCFIVRPEA